MANVLPPEYKSGLRTEYRLRLTATGVFFMVGALILVGAFLIPSYFLTQSRINTTQTKIDSVQQDFREERGGVYAQALHEANIKLNAAQGYSNDFEISNVLEGIIQEQTDEVSIRKFAFNQDDESFELSGVAATREALLSFEDALSENQQFTKVDLPISSLADETDVEFSVSLQVANQQD